MLPQQQALVFVPSHSAGVEMYMLVSVAKPMYVSAALKQHVVDTCILCCVNGQQYTDAQELQLL